MSLPGYVIPRVRNPTEEGCCEFNEISDLAFWVFHVALEIGSIKLYGITKDKTVLLTAVRTSKTT
jgi:hypothetical protein